MCAHKKREPFGSRFFLEWHCIALSSLVHEYAKVSISSFCLCVPLYCILLKVIQFGCDFDRFTFWHCVDSDEVHVTSVSYCFHGLCVLIGSCNVYTESANEVSGFVHGTDQTKRKLKNHRAGNLLFFRPFWAFRTMRVTLHYPIKHPCTAVYPMSSGDWGARKVPKGSLAP